MDPGRPLTRERARAIDRDAQERLLLPGDLLMENAGASVARHALALASEHDLARAVVLCGPGNNGGDGLVAARHLLGRLAVDVLSLAPGASFRGDAAKNLARYEKLGGAVRTIECAEDVAEALAAPPAPVVIDALFGIGLDRPLAGLAREVVESLVASDAEIVAVDVPSGLDCDTGEILGAAVVATVTVTFVATKVGFALRSGPRCCGRVIVEAIGFPPPHGPAPSQAHDRDANRK
jgi:hydroxyethylthiazole kinase-like uncharacterized protein yjeF